MDLKRHLDADAFDLAELGRLLEASDLDADGFDLDADGFDLAELARLLDGDD